MRIKLFCAVLSLITFSGVAFADLEPYKDYDVSDAVWSVTTVKVDPNMDSQQRSREKTRANRELFDLSEHFAAEW